MTTLNLLQSGFEQVAGEVKSRFLKPSRRGSFYCYVLENGDVRVRETTERRLAEISDKHLIGTYTRNTPIEVIEGDLLECQRELFAAILVRRDQLTKRPKRRAA